MPGHVTRPKTSRFFKSGFPVDEFAFLFRGYDYQMRPVSLRPIARWSPRADDSWHLVATWSTTSRDWVAL
eukprot:2256323-Pyramimonas_sp.AAC.1